MTKKLFALCALSLVTALAWGQSPVVKVEGGLVQGVASASSDVTGRPVLTTVFRGIPYAAPPVGDLRWKRPLPVVKWEPSTVSANEEKKCLVESGKVKSSEMAELKEHYQAIVEPFNGDKRYWINVQPNMDIHDEELKELVRKSYEIVTAAYKREKSDVRISSSERKQARPKARAKYRKHG